MINQTQSSNLFSWAHKLLWPGLHVSALYEMHYSRMWSSGFSPFNFLWCIFMKPPGTVFVKKKYHIRTLVNDYSGLNADECDILLKAEPRHNTHRLHQRFLIFPERKNKCRQKKTFSICLLVAWKPLFNLCSSSSLQLKYLKRLQIHNWND